MSALNRTDLINVDRNGTFAKAGSYHSQPNDIDNLIQHLKNNNITKLLLYFHGGLVSEEVGKESCEDFLTAYQGYKGHYCVGLFYETGFTEALPKTIVKTFNESLRFRTIWNWVARYLGAKFQAPSFKKIGEFDPSEMIDLEDFTISQEELEYVGNQFTQDLEQHFDERDLSYEVEEFPDSVYDEFDNLDIDHYLPLEPGESSSNKEVKSILLRRLFYKVLWRIFLRHRRNRDHYIHATITEEIARVMGLSAFGTRMWNVMKEQAEQMWRSNAGRQGRDQYVGRYLLDRLNQDLPEVGISVIAHSAGSVVTAHMAQVIHQNQMPLKLNKLFFLAPAISMERFNELLEDAHSVIAKMYIYTMTDAYEYDDNLIDVSGLQWIYPASLLYLISGILEGSKLDDADELILGLERNLKPFSQYRSFTKHLECMELLERLNTEIIYSRTAADAPEGYRSHAIDHGFFDNDPITKESIQFHMD